LNNSKYIYVVISRTPTRFAYFIRKFGNLCYNHAAISLTADLSQIYAFARPQHNALLVARLVPESLERYTLRKNTPVPIVVFRLDVSDEQYNWVKDTINSIQNDPEYMYNLFSVIFYPFIKGFKTYKAFSCVEFVAYILNHLGYSLNKPRYRCTPDDLLAMLSDKIVYEGDIRGRMAAVNCDGTYFAPMTAKIIRESVKNIFEISKRSLFRRPRPV